MLEKSAEDSMKIANLPPHALGIFLEPAQFLEGNPLPLGHQGFSLPRLHHLARGNIPSLRPGKLGNAIV
jgi:hypothetical protein